jgi:hypothetical protein
LYEYCHKWKLRLNTSKSKILVFRKRKANNRNEKWTFGNVEIESVEHIPYLGLLFSSNGLFTKAQCKLADQAKKAVFLLNKRINSFPNMQVSMQMQLFDTFIGTILNYACEVWGFHKAPEIEGVHLNFCKHVLNVKRTTQNDFVYGELGRYPMYIKRYHKIIKYWLNIVLGKKSVYMNALYKDSLLYVGNVSKYCWSREVMTLLFECGYGEVWYSQGVPDPDAFLLLFKARLNDMYFQGWQGRLNESTRADFYRNFKTSFVFSSYLNSITVKSHRIAFTKLITSSHRLAIETGRWQRPVIPRSNRLCVTCNRLDDEYHFLLECSKFSDIRTRLIKKYYWQRPSMHKCLQLLTTTGSSLKNLAKFVFLGFSIDNTR